VEAEGGFLGEMRPGPLRRRSVAGIPQAVTNVWGDS